MSLTKATNYLKEKGYADHIIILEQSTATVMEAADALGVKPGMMCILMKVLRGTIRYTLRQETTIVPLN